MTQRIALVTGGSRGLGKNTVLALAERGIDAIFTYRQRDDDAQRVVEEAAQRGATAVALALDMGNSSTFATFAQQVVQTLQDVWQRERFDYLVNNAGAGLHAPFIQTQEADFDQLVNVHFKGPFFLTQALLPLMVDGGRILNVASGLTRFVLPGFAAYAAVKGAMEVLTRYQAKELGSRGITANIIAPGAIATDFGGGAVRDDPALNQTLAGQTALGRVGEADDIGQAVVALLSDELGWMNAQRVEVSGGMFL